jgi:hypothetical protein
MTRRTSVSTTAIRSFTQGYLDFIDRELQAVSKGVISAHHVHNVQSMIINILALLEPDEVIIDASENLARMAASYINRRDRDGDTARFSAAVSALANFRATLERGRLNCRVQTRMVR